MFKRSVCKIPALLEKTVVDSTRWQISDLFQAGRTVTLSFLNAHGVNTTIRTPEFGDFLMSSDYLLRDGIGVKLALSWLGYPKTENLNGTDLITQIIFSYKNKKIAIFGASDETIMACRARLEGEGLTHIVAMKHGFLPDDTYMAICRDMRPDMVVLCMGMPRQELLATKLRDQSLAPVIICGGGWADFYSGVKKRAPLWMRRMSLEWLHRLWREPKRLGKRYTIDLIYFFFLLALARLWCGQQNGAS